jgi:tetratricopeptide (TPR) repeat protein
MLNLTDIAERIAHPEKCEISDFEDLKSFAIQYPYCQLFPILSLKALANYNDIRFDVELAQFAYRISDRSQLYALIHQNIETKSSQQTISVETYVEGIVEIPEETEVVTLTQEAEEIQETENVSQEIQTPEHTSFVEDTIEEQELHTKEEIKQPVIAADDEDFEDENEAVFIPLNISSIDEVIISEANEEEPESTSNVEKEINQEIVIEESRHASEETISAAYRLEELETEEDEETEESDKADVNEQQVSSQNRSFTEWLRVGIQSTSNELEEDKSHLYDLLNRFIENEPKISRPTLPIENKPKRPFYSPEKKAKESVDIQHMPVSETLGRILELQGNYQKAIFVYEQLLLSNPEKKSYFATRIEDINKKINS